MGGYGIYWSAKYAMWELYRHMDKKVVVRHESKDYVKGFLGGLLYNM